MQCSTLFIVLTGVLLYLVMGALVFNALEAPYEESYHVLLQIARQEFLGNNTCVSPEHLAGLLDTVAAAISVGIDPSSNGTFSTSWDLGSAFFFCGTIVTTIGYGNISPKTSWGQFFCIWYTLVGIPLFGFLLAAAGDHLGTSLRNAIAKIEALLWKWKVSPTIVRVITALLSILLGCVLFIFVPTLVFQKVENWSLLESAYFVVITLTTVGFGDYVAAGEPGTDHWYKPLVWFWILFGLAYFVSILSMIGNWILVLTKKTRAEMEELRAHASDWTQNIQNMSVDFRMAGKFDDPFKRTRRKHRHRHHKHSGSQGGSGEAGKDGREDNESGSSSYSSSSDGSYSSSESDSEVVTKTERVPEGETTKDVEKEEKLPKDATFSQPLDYFGENLAFIDESSDAVSGKVHPDPLLDKPDSNPTSNDKPKRRRQRRHLRRDLQKSKSTKTSPNEQENMRPNGDVQNKDPSPLQPKL
ncbi:potassium channel subfamily K member 4 [Paramisgurnus dabryanus]|uniref:potassium channel subfamily K member 4 n=1 Tax=Paramisgurnus dabryanus TaxID=90735 RepID=UPI0031F3A1AC